MLDQALKQQLVTIFADLQADYLLEVTADPNHPNRAEMTGMMGDVAATSDRITFREVSGTGLSLRLFKGEVALSVTFRAIPTGHEFTTLLLLILNADSKGKNLPDAQLIGRIRNLKGGVTVRSYISLTCTNCPDVVQAINLLSIYNPNIQHEIVDGALNPDEVKAIGVQAVPTLYAGEKLLSVGRASLAELIEKLENSLGTAQSEMPATERHYDVVVAGGGPAGVSAAIYSARKGLKVAIVADRIGGQVLETMGIENLISVAHTSGKKLGGDLRSHLEEYAIDVLDNRKIRSFNVESGIKQIETSYNETILSPALIIATGAQWRKLNVPGESDYIGSGVAFCTHCDGPFYKGKRVAVIGGGNSGLEAAIDLANIASEVTLLEFAPELKGDQVLQDKLRSMPHVTIRTNVATTEIVGNGTKVTALRLKDRQTDHEALLDLDGVFVQIGLSANSAIFRDHVEVNQIGEIVIDAHTRTSVPGVYAAGDVTTVPFKQIVIAMGEGAKASLSAFEDSIKGKLMHS